MNPARCEPVAPDDTVYDAEALVAYFADEPGAKTTQHDLQGVIAGTHSGYLNEVNAAEVWYILKRHAGPESADDCLDWLKNEAGVQFIASSDTWSKAAAIKADHRLSLGDAFALATGQLKSCSVLTGNDKEFDIFKLVNVKIRRIRDRR